MAISRLYCVVILFMITLSYGQKIKTVHVIDSCKAEDIVYHYDKKGLLTEEITNKKTFEGKNNVVYKDAYLYDRDKVTKVLHFCNDTLISQEITDYKGSDMIRYRQIVKGDLKIDEVYSYNKGKLQKTTTFSAGNSVVKEVRYDKGLRLKETTIKDGTTVTGIEKEYTHGNGKTVEYYSIPADSVTASVTVNYIYDDNGNVMDMTTFNRGKEVKREINRYDDNNVMVSHKEYAAEVLTVETLYDLSGNILKETHYKTNEIYLYDSKYNKLGDITYVSVIKNGKPVCEKKYTNEYWEKN